MKPEAWLTCDNPGYLLEYLGHAPKESGPVWVRKSYPSLRKVRLLMVGCCRMVFNFLAHNHSRDAVVTAELFADGKVDEETLDEARRRARHVDSLHWSTQGHSFIGAYTDRNLVMAAYYTTAENHQLMEWFNYLSADLNGGMVGSETGKVPRKVQADLARDIFRHPTEPDLLFQGRLTNWDLCNCNVGNICPLGRVGMEYRCSKSDFVNAGVIPDNHFLYWNDRTIPDLARAIYEERAFDRMPVLRDALEESGCTIASMLDHCLEPLHCRGCWLIDMILGKI